MSEKCKVGLLGLMFELYDRYPHIKPAMADFASELAHVISPYAEVIFPGICNTRTLVNYAIERFESENVDLLLVVLLTYAPSHIALPALCKTRLPILIFNTQQQFSITSDINSDVTFKNHGMHGVQDLANVLIRAKRDFQIVTGHYKDPRALNEIKEWCDAVRVTSFMRGVRIGLLGYPMEQMGDFAIDETTFLSQIGVEVQRIPMKVVADTANSAPADEIKKQMDFDRNNFLIDQDVKEESHEASSRLEWAFRSLMKQRGMHGFASHFTAISEDGRIETLPFLAASKLLAEGYGYGGEGDVTSSAAVTMMIKLAGMANFTEMFTMDFGGNAILMSHMGEGNWKMARKDSPVILVMDDLGIVDLKVPPVLLKFSLEPGDVTLVSLTTVSDGNMKFVVAEGKVVDFPAIPAINKPNYKFSPDGDLCDFLTKFSMEGGSHHQALAYGRWANTIKKIAKVMKVQCSVI